LAIIAGALLGFGIGYALYKGGNGMSVQYFLIASTCFLYLVAAGLMSRGIWFLELEQFVQRCGQDTSETGSGPGSYDIGNTIWHVNCCNGLKDGGWMLFNALLGWTNTATYGSVTSYILFWVAIVIMLKMKAIFEDEGIVPFVPVRWQLKKIRKRLSLVGVLVSEIEEERENGGNIGGSGVESAGSAGSGIPIGDLEPLLGSANASAGASAGASSN
jgi:high-affinity iron transporter